MQYDFPNSQRVDRNGWGGLEKNLLRKSPAFGGRRSNFVFSGTYLNEIDSLALAMNLFGLFTSTSIMRKNVFYVDYFEQII
jgi:hypothetical protein